ncbi:restriction endonuclease subunit S [Chitinimonas sp.]|uniref:restriction endonuclease subunit S n=1 Tax=Chitinimonas sp. TaxID=1934313 RepID=UPI002F952D82
MNQQPLGWGNPTLLDCSQFVRGVTYTKSDATDRSASGLIPIVRANNIQARGFELQNLVYVPASLVSAEQVLKCGDVVIATSSGSISVVGKAAQVRREQPMSFGAFCGVLRPSSTINARYFGHFFSSKAYRDAVSEMARGVNINNLKRDHFQAINIPLAPLAEQKRIADKLDTILARVDAVNTRLARVAPILKRFRQSVLAAATSGRLTEDWRRSNADWAMHSQWLQRNNESDPPPDINSLNVPSTWRILRAQDVVESDANIVYGIVQPGPKLVSGIPYVQTTDIADGRIQVGSLCRTSVDIANRYHRSSIKGGDVLLGIIRATKVAVVPDELSGGNISRSVARLRPCSDMVPQFLAIVLESPAVQDWFRAQHRGMDMPVLNLAQVRLAPLPIAPIEEQREIVRRVETLFAFADRLEACLLTAQTATDRLTPALLAKAFRGELVPQDPNDEPASELLRRLQQEAPSTSTRRGRKSAV